MPSPRTWIPAIALVALIAAASPAFAQPALFGTAELAGGGGHDSNVFLQAAPDAADRAPQIEAFYARVAPAFWGALAAAGWRLEGAYSLDYRASRQVGDLLYHQLGLTLVMPPLGPVQPRIGLEIGRFDALRYREEELRFAAGEVGLRVRLTDSLRATASYRAELRQYPRQAAPYDVRLVHAAELRCAYRSVSALELGLGGSYLGVVPARDGLLDETGLRVVRLGPDAELVWRRLTVGLGAWGGLLQVGPAAARWQLGGTFAAVVKLGRNLDATAVAEWTASPTYDELSRNHARRFVGLNLVAHLTGKRVFTRDDATSLAPIVRSGKVRFRARVTQAGQVQVIGSWNGWVAGAALQPSGEAGVWETWLPVPAGSHRYRLLVDGRVVRPPEAPRYVSDDFGGEDAVLHVPDALAESP